METMQKILYLVKYLCGLSTDITLCAVVQLQYMTAMNITSINITATPQRKPEAPSILDATTEGSPTSRIATFTLKNNDSYPLTIVLMIDDSSGKRLKQEELEFGPEESRYLVRQLPDGDYGIKITASESSSAGTGTDALNSILAGDDAKFAPASINASK